jgi:hypothetical protein
MPALLSHHCFGRDVLSALGPQHFSTRAERDAFNLGNQGPDPFFFAALTPQLVAYKRFGTRMHTSSIVGAFDAMAEAARERLAAGSRTQIAYLCGHICHFTLDSMAHPFIFATEKALCTAGVRGLDERDRQVVHAQIESDFDSMMLFRDVGKTVAEIRITRSLLQGDKAVLQSIGWLYAQVARQVFDIGLDDGAYGRCLRDMRLTYDLIQSRTGRKRAAIGFIERLLPLRRHSLLQALSPCSDIQESGLANLSHQSWTNPFTGISSNSSFIDIFDAAVSAAVARVAACLNGDDIFDHMDLCDFNGRPYACDMV